ncbi:SCO-spondin, partial [Biomphalaria glabrata]
KEQLLEIMRVQMMSVSPDDRESFTELCIKKRMACEEKQFSGRHAVFTWKPGTSTEAKDRFWRTYSCVYNQNINKCPVDGGWTEWSLWSKCKADCEDKGWQTRTRACENPKPAFGGNPCDGEKLANITCIGLCRSNSDGLAEAEEYIVQIHNAFPDLAGLCMEKHCLYLEVMRIIKDRFKVDKYWSSINCVKYGSACPVNGGWGEWQEYTRCSAKCGVGERFRSRKCDKPVTRNGGIPCQGEWFQETSCLGKNCSAKGVDMSDWSTFSPCSVSCGAYGVKESTKFCIKADKPCMVGGQKVEQITMAIPCYGGECPQTGGWGQWQPWTECSAECGVGRKTRFRQCDSPNPSGGESCLGIRLQTTACDGSMCIQVPKENDNEEESQQRKRRSWHNFSSLAFALSKDRSKFSLTRSPSNYFNVSKVLLPSVDSKLVQKLSIQFKTNLSTRKAKNISDTARCLPTEVLNESLSRTIKLNESLEVRTAIFTSTKIKECNPKEGPPSFGNNNNISAINKTYLGVRRPRVSREVKVEQDDPYNFELNPDLENTYTTWTLWSACSASCGGGSRTRVRSCKDKTIVCRGEIKPTQLCNIDPCPVQGGWGAWGIWQPCSETCNKGFSERYRQCDSPLPAFGGTCPGTNKETKDCNLGICLSTQNIGYSWSLWTACSLSCNGGVRKREYRVSGASGRDYVDEQVKLCNPQPCPENGLWAAWGGWAPCSEACGLGNRVRDRTCTDPAPNWGGAPCDGEGSELQTCFAGPCLDEDDYGIKLEGNGFLTYSDIGKVTGLFMVFLRLKPAALNGTIFHHNRGCKKKLTDCECSIMLILINGFLHLEVKNKREKETLKLSYSNILVLEQWQDILVIVTESWAEMRVDDDYKEEKPFSPGNPHTFNFDGQLTIGSNRF